MPVLKTDPSAHRELLDEIRDLTLWGMNVENRYRPGSVQDLYDRVTKIRELVESKGAKIS